MINVTLIAVGKLKEKYLRDAVAEYFKRLGAFCKINIIEIDEEKVGDNPSRAQIDNVLEKEGQRIIKKIPKSSSIITLCIEGKEYSSPDFSHLLDNISMTSSIICDILNYLKSKMHGKPAQAKLLLQVGGEASFCQRKACNY